MGFAALDVMWWVAGYAWFWAAYSVILAAFPMPLAMRCAVVLPAAAFLEVYRAAANPRRIALWRHALMVYAILVACNTASLALQPLLPSFLGLGAWTSCHPH